MQAVIHLPRSLDIYAAALEGLARVNAILYMDNPTLPSIYDPKAGVRYKRERDEVWRPADEVIADKWGDCEDLAAARVGELRAGGEAGARVIVVRTGPRMTHAKVQRANGAIEDPSRRLGMGGPDDKPAPSKEAKNMRHKLDEEQIGADVSTSAELTWTLDRTPTGWKGTVRVPLRSGKALIVTRHVDGKNSEKKHEAGNKALNAAAAVLDSPAAKMLIPPQAQMALQLVRNEKLRSAAKSVKNALGKFF